MGTILVIQNGYLSAGADNTVQTEIIPPTIRNERFDHQAAIQLRLETDKTRNHEITE